MLTARPGGLVAFCATSAWSSEFRASAVNAGIPVGIAVLLLAAVFGLGLGDIDGSGGYSGLSPRFLPSLVSGGLAVCGLLLLNSGLRGRFTADEDPGTQGQAAAVSPRAGRDLLWLVGGLVLHAALIGSIGFIAASTLLMVCVARGYGSRRPLRDAFIAIAIAVPIWALFSRVLGIGLPLLPLAGV